MEMYRLILYMIALILLMGRASHGRRINCCLPLYSNLGDDGCTTDITVDSITYYCVKVEESCSDCRISSKQNISSSMCTSCCATSEDACESDDSYVSTSSWSKPTAVYHYYRLVVCSQIFFFFSYSFNMRCICGFVLLLLDGFPCGRG